jgi:hypothetical protein
LGEFLRAKTQLPRPHRCLRWNAGQGFKAGAKLDSKLIYHQRQRLGTKKVILQVLKEDTFYLFLEDVQFVVADTSTQIASTGVFALLPSPGADDEVASTLSALQQVAKEIRARESFGEQTKPGTIPRVPFDGLDVILDGIPQFAGNNAKFR